MDILSSWLQAGISVGIISLFTMDYANISDDNLSASQLRKRYREMPDDQMSASQLRAKSAIPQNTFKHPSSTLPNNIVIIVVALALLSAAAYLSFVAFK